LIFNTINCLVDAARDIWIDLAFAELMAKAVLESISALSRANGLKAAVRGVPTVAISVVPVWLGIILSVGRSSDRESGARSSNAEEKFTHHGSP
jgi:hypothetical protein